MFSFEIRKINCDIALLYRGPAFPDLILTYLYILTVLIDFSLTVKAATLIFISGRGSAFSSA